ncbi:MAG: radical SAM protein [Chitinivibrionales bacterium]|nr:radical SAM protein [Chitinivibrionales bacterium]MBD3356331.1 radical SAM protein [Chitinivibrionales bacterium]
MERLKLFEGRMDLDTRCNYRCTYCTYNPSGHIQPGPINTALLDTIFPFLNRYCWHTYLSCASEPLLHPEFNTVFQKVRTHLTDTDITLVTNGFHLDEPKAEAIIDSPLTDLIISIDSVDSNTYHRTTGTQNALPRVMENIKKICRIKDRQKYP